MKVTAIIPEELIKEVHHYGRGKNLTQSLRIALLEWVALKKLRELNEEIRKNPIEFEDEFSAEKVRGLTR